MLVNIWDIIIAAGVIQSVILGVIIYFRPGINGFAGKTLSLILWVCALACIGVLLDGHPAVLPASVRSFVEKYVPFYLTLLVGPLIYVHVRSFLTKNFSITVKQVRHFYPVLFNFIPAFLFLGQSFAYHFKLPFFADALVGRLLHHYYIYGDAVFWTHLTVYLVCTMLLLRKHAPDFPNQKTYQNWLRRFLSYFLLFQLAWLPFLLIYVSNYRYLIWEYGLHYYPIYIPLVALIYWISIKWLIVAGTFTRSELEGHVILSKQEAEMLIAQLEEIMSGQRLYQNSQLNLQEMAEAIDTTPKKLSYLLNSHLASNFNDFVNKYRVQSVKEMLTDPKYTHLKIAAIAHDAGFNSIPTFQRTFKTFTNDTPSGYRRKYSVLKS